MNKRGMIIPILLVIFITVGLSLGETSGTMDNATAPAGDENGTAAENETVGQNATAANAVNLNYIWSVTGLEAEPVIMVLNQDGNDLYGAAKYEPDSGSHWNADVIGSISDDNVDLTLTAQVDEKLVTTKLDGFFDNASQTLDGKFTEVSGGKIANKGNFSAMWINPDTSSYTPAEIEEKKPATPAPTQAPAETANDTATQTSSKKSYYVDVHEYADKIGPGGDLSGVPPGMGGSGLGA